MVFRNKWFLSVVFLLASAFWMAVFIPGIIVHAEDSVDIGVTHDDSIKNEEKGSVADVLQGTQRIKTLSVKTRMKEEPEKEMAGLPAEDPFIFAVQADIEGDVSSVLLETWFLDSEQKESYGMLGGGDGKYSVEIPYDASGIYNSKDGKLCYRIKIKDAFGQIVETSGDGFVQAYGGYLDGKYLGARDRNMQEEVQNLSRSYFRAYGGPSFQERGQGLDVWGSYAVSGTMAITGTIRIHGDSTLWLETQNGYPSLYLNGDTGIIGDGPQSKVILSRKLQLRNDAGGIALQSGSAVFANLSFSSEDSHIGGVSGQSHGIWGNTGTSMRIQNCRMSSRATSTIVGTYGNLYAENTAFQDGRTGIHFNGSFGGLEVHTKNCTFQRLDEGIQGGTLNGKRSMSLYLDGWNGFEDIAREAVAVSNGEYVSFSSSSSADFNRVGSGVAVTNCTKAAIRNARLSGKSTQSGIGLLFDHTNGAADTVSITNFNAGLQTQSGSIVKGVAANIQSNAQGVTNRASYDHEGGEIANNLGKGVYHGGDSFRFGGGEVKNNGACDVYLETGRVIDWPGHTQTGRPRILTRSITLGTPLVRNQFGGAGSAGEAYFSAAHGGRYTARGGDRNGCGGNLLVLSSFYNIAYDKNQGDAVGNMPGNGIKYWNEVYRISDAMPVWTHGRFKGWNENRGANTGVYQPSGWVPLSLNRDMILYAVWDSFVLVKYAGNSASSGTPGTETATYDGCLANGGYGIRSNTGYTNFSKADFKFMGWSASPKTSPSNTEYPDNAIHKVSYDAIRDIASRQGTAGGDSPYMTLYAIWDKLPQIHSREQTFYEGFDFVGESEILGRSSRSQAWSPAGRTTAEDQEDGDLTGSVKIMKISYPAFTRLTGAVSQAYVKEYPGGMKETDRLCDRSGPTYDWFMDLEKYAASDGKGVPIIVTASITDSAGSTAFENFKVYVKYNHYPAIESADRYFSHDDAKAGKITKDMLLAKSLKSGVLKISDKETPSSKLVVDLDHFDPDAFKNVDRDAKILVTYRVQDDYGPSGKGKATYLDVPVYITEDGSGEGVSEWATDPRGAQIRFVDSSFYERNAGRRSDGLTKAEQAVLNENGGLNVESVWYQDPAYRTLIRNSLHRSTGDTYAFDEKKIREVRSYIVHNKDVGMQGGLKEFAEKFGIR